MGEITWLIVEFTAEGVCRMAVSDNEEGSS
jgi:hypothetical protein